MPTEPLKLIALEDQDLAPISALMQDAVFRPVDVSYSKAAGQLELQCNRFVWEEKRGFFRKPSRRRAVLVCKRVTAVRSVGIDRNAEDAVANLLAIQFEQSGEGPEGALVLTLSGGGEIVAEVECIEAMLADLSGDWEARGTPHHPR